MFNLLYRQLNNPDPNANNKNLFVFETTDLFNLYFSLIPKLIIRLISVIIIDENNIISPQYSILPALPKPLYISPTLAAKIKKKKA